VSLRPAKAEDVPLLLRLVHELAAYERAPDGVKMTEAQFRDALFGPKPRAEALIAELDGAPVGFAVWYQSFNTWTGTPALYLEDFFLRPAARGRGLGKQIFTYLAGLAVERGYARMEWMVLDWNDLAIDFYTGMGATPLPDWTKFRLSGDALTKLAAGVTGLAGR